MSPLNSVFDPNSPAALAAAVRYTTGVSRWYSDVAAKLISRRHAINPLCSV
jgi:hypothetical protein